ncbi:MAG: hypothetical protein HOV80_00390 [Polyangiaceae bacterium]|nr:hypothetical protein [Polyangiaceae bacterium]
MSRLRLLAALVIVIVPLAATCGAAFPTTVRTSRGMWSSVCPSDFEDVDRGAYCAEANAFEEAPNTRPVCDYAEGYCGCELDKEKAEYVWVCRIDTTAQVCPFDRHETPIGAGDACDQLGKICSYPEGEGCFRSFRCMEGRWVPGAAVCHPSPASLP